MNEIQDAIEQVLKGGLRPLLGTEVMTPYRNAVEFAPNTIFKYCPTHRDGYKGLNRLQNFEISFCQLKLLSLSKMSRGGEG